MRAYHLAGVVLLALALACPAGAVEVRETNWGFDGHVVPQRINLLSVLLANNGAEPFDGVVTLQRSEGPGGHAGPEFAEPCYLAPFTSRWVQFYPYVGDADSEQWEVLIGRDRMALPTPRPGPPAAVCLDDPGNPLAGRAGLRTFREELFPVTVSATDGLALLVMDCTPRWEAVRQQAMLDWLRRGGTLYLLPDGNGRYLQFGGEMSVLNHPADRFRVGAGLVMRHRVGRREVNTEFLAGTGPPLPQLQSSGFGHVTLDQTFLAGLKSLAQPVHNWALIYVSLLGYVLLIGPVNYLLGRKAARSWRAVLFFLCTVALFAWGMGALGRRGFGERASVRSLAYAQPVGGDQYDVTQWIDVFATDGGYYTLRHGTGHGLYATCEEYGPVNGAIESGANGRFEVDIPMFSNRPFLHRARMQGHALGLEVRQWREQRGALTDLTLGVGPGFPPELVEAWVLHGGRVLRATYKDGALQLGGGRVWQESEFLDADRLDLDAYRPYYMREDRLDERTLAQKAAPALIARAVGGSTNSRYGITQPRPADEAQLFLLCASPPGFALQGKGLGHEAGYVLYHVRLHRPEDTNG